MSDPDPAHAPRGPRLPRIALTARMLGITLAVGLAVWAVLDYMHSRSFQAIFEAQLQERFSREARAERVRFDQAIKRYHDAAMLFASHRPLHAYLEGGAARRAGAPRAHRDPPPWLPNAAVLRGFGSIRYAFLVRADTARVLEYYRSLGRPPQGLLEPSPYLLLQAQGQSYLTNLEGRSYLVAAAPVSLETGPPLLLVLASPLDDRFLIEIQGASTSRNVLALVDRSGERVLVSSNPERIPAGTPIDALKERYLITGRAFFDYGASELVIRLMSLVSTDEVAETTATVLGQERFNRAAGALAFVVAFALIMAWITRRIERLRARVTAFSERMGLRLSDDGRGDQIHQLERRFHQLTERVIEETQALEHYALHDTLTELPNRMLLYDRLEQTVLSSRRLGQTMALLMMDLDRFKEINDTLGHHIGDQMLQAIGRRLHETLRRSDTIARLGGDEFAVLLPATDVEGARQICAKILEAVETPVTIDTHSLDVGISVGVALYPEHGDDANTLMQKADVAMYVAKRNGVGFAFYDPEQDEHSLSRLALMGALRDAIDRDALEVHYQPVVDMRTGQVVSVEALVRWSCPERGYISPEEFIPMAEQTGVIRPLTQWVFDRAVAQCAEWQRAGLDISVALNVSVRTLHDLQFPVQIRSLIERHGVRPDCLILEVTESAIMSDADVTRTVMTRLSALGVRLSIDDFGTGYSSLSYLKQLPVDELKIDKTFVMHMAYDDNDAVIVRATVDLAHNLGLVVVGEGVEGSENWDLLRILGCDKAQGYFIMGPVTAEEFEVWLADTGGRFNTRPNFRSSSALAG